MQDPLPSINKAFASIIQEERQCGITVVHVDVEKPIPPPSGEFVGGIQSQRQELICTHCGISGHTMAKCYRLNGYPPGHKLHNIFSNKGNGSNQTKNSQGNAIANLFGTNDDVVEDNSGGTQDPFPNLSPNQCQQLIAFLAQKFQNDNSSTPQTQPGSV
uniref:Uncharacterized protein n=1 Tax=Cannabis sativa TaxID=3483 RepID=A0A803NFM0_CANSA